MSSWCYQWHNTNCMRWHHWSTFCPNWHPLTVTLPSRFPPKIPEGAGECVYEAEARTLSWGCDGGPEGLSSSHRSALSCFWTPVIPFLAPPLKQFSLSASPCHRKSPRQRMRSELMGVSLLPHSSLQLPAQMPTLRRRVDWKHSQFTLAERLSASLSQIK